MTRAFLFYDIGTWDLDLWSEWLSLRFLSLHLSPCIVLLYFFVFVLQFKWELVLPHSIVLGMKWKSKYISSLKLQILSRNMQPEGYSWGVKKKILRQFKMTPLEGIKIFFSISVVLYSSFLRHHLPLAVFYILNRCFFLLLVVITSVLTAASFLSLGLSKRV